MYPLDVPDKSVSRPPIGYQGQGVDKRPYCPIQFRRPIGYGKANGEIALTTCIQAEYLVQAAEEDCVNACLMHQSELLERFVDVCIQVKFEAPTSLLVRVCGHVPSLQFFGAIELLREMGDGLLVTLRLKLIVLVSNIVQIINGSRQVYWMLRFFVLAQYCVG